MSTYEKERREEDRWLGRLMFDEICEIRPNVSLQVERKDGVFTACVFESGFWKPVAMGQNLDATMASVVDYLGITEDEIDANAERRSK